MLIIPIETPGHAADAAEVILRQTGRTLINPTIIICHESPSPEFARLLQTKDLSKIVDYLRRGFEFRPDKGDHDRGPETLGSQN